MEIFLQIHFTRYDRRSNRHIFYCAGSLIALRFVLTSASCFERYDSMVAFGPTSTSPVAWLGTNVLGGPTAVSRYVIRVNKFPHYDPANFGNRDNIAVVKLQSEVLPTTATPGILGLNSNPKMGVANELIAVGWGYSGGNGFTSYVLHSWMNLIPNSDCQKVFGNVDNAYTICVAYNSVGACARDVGSPILSKDGKIIGVVGKNQRCGGGEPIVAVKIVPGYYHWILSQLN